MTTVAEKNLTFSGFVKAQGQTTTTWYKSRRQQCDQTRWAELRTYSKGTLIANWNEDTYDIRNMAKATPQPSQFDHCYQSTYRASYNKAPSRVPECLRYTAGKKLKPCAFPSHQPVLDTPKLRQEYSSYLTSSRQYGSSIHTE